MNEWTADRLQTSKSIPSPSQLLPYLIPKFVAHTKLSGRIFIASTTFLCIKLPVMQVNVPAFEKAFNYWLNIPAKKKTMQTAQS